MTPAEWFQAALEAYKTARNNLEVAEERWSRLFGPEGAVADLDPLAASAAYDALTASVRQFHRALEALWEAFQALPPSA